MDARAMDLPGTPAMVPLVRTWARAFLVNDPRVHAAELVIAELVANAIRHSASGEHGGGLRVEITHETGAVLVAVHDDGPRSHPPEDWTAEESANCGRGLTIVNALSGSWGEEKSPDGRRVTWARVSESL